MMSLTVLLTFSKGGQYIDKILGRIKKSPSYNDMGENKLEDNKNKINNLTLLNSTTYTIFFILS